MEEQGRRIRKGADYGALVERMLRGERAALARLITLVESRAEATGQIMSRLHPHCGRADVVGVTGPPGAGKSTLVDRLVHHVREDGRQVGVIAVDPSSPFSGGAVLGDRIRMQSHFLDEGVFIRSLSSRGSLGGLARATRDVTRLLDAFGKNLVLVETVGVGQSEFDIMRLAETVVVVLVPEAGDAIQTMKAGLLEIADILVVNKADRDGADRIRTELEAMLRLRPEVAWRVPVLMTTARDGVGVEAVLKAIDEHHAFLRSGEDGEARAASRRSEEFLATLRGELDRRLERGLTTGALARLDADVRRGAIDPYGAAVRVFEEDQLLRGLVKQLRG